MYCIFPLREKEIKMRRRKKTRLQHNIAQIAKNISKVRNMFVASRGFLYNITKDYGKHPVSTDGGTWYPPQACKFLKLQHHLHSTYEKSIIIERTIQYIKKIELQKV